MTEIYGGPFAVLIPEQAEAAALRPLVVLLGWVEAQRDAALMKYAQLLAAAGYPSCRSVQPTLVAFSPLDSDRRKWAIALLDFLQSQQLWPQRHLVLYAFSNAGAFVVEQLLLLAEGDERFAQLPNTVAGLVFDSAPAYMHPGMLRRVLATTEPPSLRRWLKSSYFEAAMALQPLLSGRPFGPSRPRSFWANMLRLGWGRPQLFLYSTDDPLCDGQKVAELVADKRRLGQHVQARQWEQSGHVAHFRHHRQEYTQLLLSFLAGLPAAQGSAAAAEASAAPPRAKL